jgi:hypothetical protein
MAVMLALFAAELWLAYPHLQVKTMTRTMDAISPDGAQENSYPAGSASAPGHDTAPGSPGIQQTKVVIQAGDEPAYEVIYSSFPDEWGLTPYGWRVTPQHPEAEKAVVFFGCSFTFGFAINDTDTYPYKAAEMLGPEYQVYNRGINGSGPHNMLYALERGLLDDIARQRKYTFVFFTTIDDHPLRSAGYVLRTNLANPKYAAADGRLVFQGMYDDEFSLATISYRLFKRSQIYRTVAALPGGEQMEPVFDLYAGLIKQADEELRNRYGLQLTALVWPGQSRVREILARHDIRFLDLGRFFPEYEQNAALYILPYDSHPTSLANEIAARAITEFILNPENGPDQSPAALSQ